MVYVIGFITVLLAFLNVGQAAPTLNPTPFKVWKQERVQESHQRVLLLRNLINLRKRQIQSDNKNKTEAGLTGSANVQKLEMQLFQEQQGLELSKKLSISDYFIMYLTTLPADKDTFRHVAKQLNTDDMAELMLMYSQYLNSGTATGGESPTANEKLTKVDAKSQSTNK